MSVIAPETRCGAATRSPPWTPALPSRDRTCPSQASSSLGLFLAPSSSNGGSGGLTLVAAHLVGNVSPIGKWTNVTTLLFPKYPTLFNE